MRCFSHFAALLLICLGCNPAALSTAFQRKPEQPVSSTLSETTAQKIKKGKRLTLRERTEVKKTEKARYIELRQNGGDEVSNTAEAVLLRNFRLRNKKHTGLIFKKDKSLADLDNLPEPDVLAGEIIENLEAGLNSFREIAAALS